MTDQPPLDVAYGQATGARSGATTSHRQETSVAGPRAVRHRLEASAKHTTDGGWSPGPVLTVVAHPDDDLFFINPGVSTVIASGAPAVSIVLTAAEGDGRNVDTADPRRERVPVDYVGYSTARRAGLRRAYARMAGLPVDSDWVRELIELDAGFAVEQDLLVAAPQVVLYFFNLGHRLVDGRGRTTLLPLCDEEIDECPTLPSGDLPAPVQAVSREMVVGAIAELMGRHRPAVVRTLDPDPEHDWGQPEFVVSDHTDHTATARLALAAVQRYGASGNPAPVVEYHRGYANRYWPNNLGVRVRQEKRDYLLTYAGADGAPAPGPGHSYGDFQLGPEPYRSSHMFSTAQRYVATSTWLVRLPTGALAAFAVLGDRLAIWSECGPGSGCWSGPRLAGESGLMPSLAIAAGPQGPVQVLALRRTEAGKGVIDVAAGYYTVDPAGGFSAWQSLGGPDDAEPDRRRQREIGVPAATVDGAGFLWVFVRDFTGGLSFRRATVDGWGPWESLGDGPLQDVPVAATTAAGLVEVFVAGKRTVAHWRQERPGGSLVANTTLRSTPVASGGLHVVRTAGDRACLYFRQANTGQVLAYCEYVMAGTWPDGPAELGAPDGIGPVAVLGRTDAGVWGMVMAQRNGAGTVSVAVPPTDARPRWRELPGLTSGGPALAMDQHGRAVLAVLGLDGRLHVCRQNEPEPTSPFGGWTTV